MLMINFYLYYFWSHKETSLIHIFTVLALWADLVIESPCLSVCLCHCETPTAGCHGDFWLEIVFLILAYVDTILKRKLHAFCLWDCWKRAFFYCWLLVVCTSTALQWPFNCTSMALPLHFHWTSTSLQRDSKNCYRCFYLHRSGWNVPYAAFKKK